MSDKSTEIARFADVAMFTAEPVDVEAGPQVHLLWMTPDPLGAIAAACMMYEGRVIRDLRTITDEERIHYLKQITKTKLKAPFEFVKFHFLIEGVTRSFTHQMVRQRTAVYAQESLRFAVKTSDGDPLPVALPPSIRENTPEAAKWYAAIDGIADHYDDLINMGVPAEDARGLLPHNVMTRLHYSTDLRALLDHAGNRLCTQAQFEWRIVFSQIAKQLRDISTGQYHGWIDGIPFTANDANGIDRAWMSNAIADIFAPVCYQTGKCEFKAAFDRHCNIRERVNYFESHGISSSEWDSDRKHEEHAIHPEEWLLNHGAARRKGNG